MSTMVSESTYTEKRISVHSAKPSFFGLVRGELFKISRQWTTWIMLVLFLGAICLPYLVLFADSGLKDAINSPTADYFYSQAAAGLAVLRVFGGFFVVILTARVIGQEYSQGTIRIILARGVGRVQLLFAKWTAIVTWAIIILLSGLVLNLLLAALQIQIVTGSLTPLTSLSSSVWHDFGLYVLAIMISLGATILMATAITVLLRSLAGGLSASIAWFPADNIIVGILAVAALLTKADFWKNISAYLLGPNLNVMAGLLARQDHTAWKFGTPPVVDIDSTHALVVVAVYSAIFVFVAIYLTWKRDVKE